MSNVLLSPKTERSPNELTVCGLALMVAEIALPEQVSAILGIPAETLFELLNDPQMQRIVEVEIFRLHQSGKRADLKAEKLIDRMLSKLLAMDPGEVSAGMALKIAELGLKFRDKSPENSPPRPKASVVVRMPGDPEPKIDAEYGLIIDLSRVPINKEPV